MSKNTLKSKYYYLPEPKKKSFLSCWRRSEPSVQYRIQHHPAILWNGITSEGENLLVNVIYDVIEQNNVHAFMTELGCKPFV